MVEYSCQDLLAGHDLRLTPIQFDLAHFGKVLKVEPRGINWKSPNLEMGGLGFRRENWGRDFVLED